MNRFFDVEGKGVDTESGEYLKLVRVWNLKLEDDVVSNGAVRKKFLITIELA